MPTPTVLRDTTPAVGKTKTARPRILVVDDDDALRAVIKEHLSRDFDVVETGAPETVFALTVAHRPDAILLDLFMPELSGFELCRALASLSFTQKIPVFIMSGRDDRNSAFCLSLGAARYFKKPLDFGKLKLDLQRVLQEPQDERRAHARFSLKAILKLRAPGKDGSPLEFRAVTENVSRGGFLCACNVPLEQGSAVDVFSWDEREYYLGKARLVRIEQAGTPSSRYAFQFVEPAPAFEGGPA